jgi:hypothetical protein
MHRLFNFLLNYLMFCGTMFFAAGAPAITEGGGGSDGNVGAGTGGEAADSGSVAPIGEDGGDSLPSGDQAGVEGVGKDGQTDPNALVDSGDGRKIPQKYAELFKTDKVLRDMFFSQATLRRTFPGGVKDAVELAKNVEELGGLDGVEQLQTDLKTYTADAELFEKDQAKWIETSFGENADASLKAFDHALDYVAEHHSDHYNHAMAKVIQNTLDKFSPIHDIYTLLAGLTDNPTAQNEAKKLAGWYNGLRDIAAKIPEKKLDPEQKKLDARGAELDQKGQELRNKTINLEALPYMTKTIESALDKTAKASGFDIAKLKTEQANRYGRFLKDVTRAIHENVLKDEKWMDRYAKALVANDTAKCVRMLNARHDQAITGNDREPGVVSAIFQEWFGTGKPVVKKEPGQQPSGQRQTTSTGSAPVRVSAMPPKNEIDWHNPKTKIIDQVAMRRDGKLVTWAS